MKLFEVDQGSARDVLAVLQGLANKDGQSSELPYHVVMNVLRPFALGISTTDAMIALKNAEDPAGDVIQDVVPDKEDPSKFTLVLKTNEPSQMQQDPATKTSGGPTMDQMAKSGAKKLTPDI